MGLVIRWGVWLEWIGLVSGYCCKEVRIYLHMFLIPTLFLHQHRYILHCSSLHIKTF